MLPAEVQLTTLPYVLICAAVTSLTLKGRSKSLWRLYAALIALLALLALKMYIESQLRPPNFYEAMGLHKHSTVMQVHTAFKALTSGFGVRSNMTPEVVQRTRYMYEVLMENEVRDAYNRFGEWGLLENVHVDELQLIWHIAKPYIFWLGIVLLMTTDAAARHCRPWIATAGIAMMIVDTSLCMTSVSLPWSLFPPTMTEFELRWQLHSLFAGLCMVLRAFAVYRHFDAAGCCAEVVSLVRVQNDVIKKTLQHIRSEVDAEPVATITTEEELAKMNSHVQQSSQHLGALSSALHAHVNRPRNNYYWILFGLLYAGVYIIGT